MFFFFVSFWLDERPEEASFSRAENALQVEDERPDVADAHRARQEPTSVVRDPH
jgi:hypothetical protein